MYISMKLFINDPPGGIGHLLGPRSFIGLVGLFPARYRPYEADVEWPLLMMLLSWGLEGPLLANTLAPVRSLAANSVEVEDEVEESKKNEENLVDDLMKPDGSDIAEEEEEVEEKTNEADDEWSEDVKTKWTPPAGLFTEPATKIATVLHKASKDLDQAMSRLDFYINRAGKLLKPKDKQNLEAVKPLLRKKFA